MEPSQDAPPSNPRWAAFKDDVSNRLTTASNKLNIKSIFLIHFSWCSWIMVGSYGGIGYLFHSLILLLLLLYSFHSQSNCDIIAFVLFVEVSSFFLELNYIIFHGAFTLAVVLIVIHMLFRIVASFALMKEFNLRGGTDIYNALFSMPLRSYDDLERPHLNVPASSEYMKNRAEMGLAR